MQKKHKFFSVFLLQINDLHKKAKNSVNSNQAKIKPPYFKNCLTHMNLKCTAF